MCLFFFHAVQMKSQSDSKSSSVPCYHQYRCLSTFLIRPELLPPPTQYFLDTCTVGDSEDSDGTGKWFDIKIAL